MKQTILDQSALKLVDGVVHLRFIKRDLDSAGAIVAQQYHRSIVADGVDADAQIAAISAHLAAMGEAPINDEDANTIRRFVAGARA